MTQHAVLTLSHIYFVFQEFLMNRFCECCMSENENWDTLNSLSVKSKLGTRVLMIKLNHALEEVISSTCLEDRECRHTQKRQVNRAHCRSFTYIVIFKHLGDNLVSILIAKGCRFTHSVDLHHLAHKWEGGCLHAVHCYSHCTKVFVSHFSISCSLLVKVFIICTQSVDTVQVKENMKWLLGCAASDQGSSHLLFCHYHPHSQHGRKGQYILVFY